MCTKFGAERPTSHFGGHFGVKKLQIIVFCNEGNRHLAEKTNVARKRERQDPPMATSVPSASRAGHPLAKNLIREMRHGKNPKTGFSQGAEVEGKNLKMTWNLPGKFRGRDFPKKISKALKTMRKYI